MDEILIPVGHLALFLPSLNWNWGDLIRLRVVPVTPYNSGFVNKMLWLTQSNAFYKSQRMPPTTFLSFIARRTGRLTVGCKINSIQLTSLQRGQT
jgi:hypothetical protein